MVTTPAMTTIEQGNRSDDKHNGTSIIQDRRSYYGGYILYIDEQEVLRTDDHHYGGYILY